MKHIISQILALSLKAKIAAATVAIVGITGATTAGVIHYKNVIAKNEQIKVSEIKKGSAADTIQTVPNSTETSGGNTDNSSSQAASNINSTNSADIDNKTTQTVSSNTPNSTSQNSTGSSSTSSSSSKSKTASSNTTGNNSTSSSNPTPSVSPYYVASPSCNSTIYNSALTEKLWSLKKENSYEGIKANTFDSALKGYGCGDENAINNALGYHTVAGNPNSFYKCLWNEYGYGMCVNTDVMISKYVTSSNDATQIMDSINNSSFYKPFTADSATESYFYRKVFICYNPNTKQNIVVRLAIGIARCMQQF